MPKPLPTLAALCLALLAPLSMNTQAQSASAAAASGGAAARVIVKYKSDSNLLRKHALSASAQHAEQAQALGQRVGLALRAGGGVADRTHVVFADGLSSEQLAQRLARESDVEYAVVDQRRRRFAAPNDPLYAAVAGSNGPAVGQWYLRAPAATVKSSIDVEAAWAVTTGSASIVVAVIDGGVRFEHPDLQSVAAGGNLLPGYDMITDTDMSNDGNGRDADASDPGNWITAAEANDAAGPFYQCTGFDPNTGKYVSEDSSWHGTQLAGLIGALTDNGIGMASVGRNVRVLPVRVLGKCGGFDSDILAGMRWAAGLSVPGVPANSNPARVLNLSLGGGSACTAAYRDAVAAINAVGAVVVASAGNSAGHAVSEPANCPGVIGVAGLRHVGTKVGYSDIGPEITISAPGGNCVNDIRFGLPCLYPILTTANSGTTVPHAGGSIYTDSFNFLLGTSFSSPLVAGAVALMLSAQPALTPAQVRSLIQSSSRAFPPSSSDPAVPLCVAPTGIDQDECHCTTSTCGAGMLDAGAAVRAALAVTPPPQVTSVSNPTATEGASLVYTVALSNAAANVTNLPFTLGGGSASAGDYGAPTFSSGVTLAGGTLTVPAGVTSFTITLPTTQDTLSEANETVPLTVGSATGTGTILDDDPTPVPSSGGGGAVGAAWLTLLAAAVLALLSAAPRRHGV